MPKRILQGTVVSDKQNKTIVVQVERRYTHPLFKKTVRKSKHYHAHDEANKFKAGDLVSIQETRPLSKLKRWAVLDGGIASLPAAQGAAPATAAAEPAAVKPKKSAAKAKA